MAESRSHGPRHTSIQRLLIVRLSAMGDIIHSLPAATALRHAFPEATIGWVIEERWTELLCSLRTARSGPRSPQRPLVDRIHTVNLPQWRRSLLSNHTWEAIASGLSELRGIGYQVAVDFQGAVRSALLARFSGAPTIYGDTQPRENAASMFYTRQVRTQGTHVIEQSLALAEAVAGRSLELPGVMFPVEPAAERECDEWLQERGMREFAVINPGAGWGAKQWPAERYGRVSKALAEDGIRSLVNYGPGEESLAHGVQETSGGAAEALPSSITQLIAFMRRARMFIGGDTGPMHLAAAMRVPVVGIFGPTNPARNGPFGTCNVVLRNPESETTHARRDEPEQGMLTITTEEVVAAARKLLRNCHG